VPVRKGGLQQKTQQTHKQGQQQEPLVDMASLSFSGRIWLRCVWGLGHGFCVYLCLSFSSQWCVCRAPFSGGDG